MQIKASLLHVVRVEIIIHGVINLLRESNFKQLKTKMFVKFVNLM